MEEIKEPSTNVSSFIRAERFFFQDLYKNSMGYSVVSEIESKWKDWLRVAGRTSEQASEILGTPLT